MAIMPRNSMPLPDKTLGALHAGLPFAVYSERVGINASGLKDVLKSPGHYRANTLAPQKSTPSMELGTLVHAMLLEPHRVEAAEQDEKYVWLPGDAPDEQPTRYTQAAFAQGLSMAEAARKNDVVARLLSKGQAEVSVWWTDPVHQMTCKARIDFISENAGDKPMALDIKTCREADVESFSKAAYNFRYDLQAAHYCEAGRETGAFNHDRFAFVAITSSPPYYATVFFVGLNERGEDQSDQFLVKGSEWRDYAMRVYKHAEGNNAWSFPQASYLRLPAWAKTPQTLIDAGVIADA